MQGNLVIGQILSKLMSSGLKQAAKKVFASSNPEKLAMGMIDAMVGRNQKYSQLWEQAKNMAFSGTEQEARQKAKNLYSERGVNLDEVIDGVMREIRE